MGRWSGRWESNGNGTETQYSTTDSNGNFETLTQDTGGNGRTDHLHGYHNSDGSLRDYSYKSSTGQHIGYREVVQASIDVAMSNKPET